MLLLPVPSSNQLVDIFTKALPPQSFNTNLSKLQLQNIFAPPACGGLIEETYNPSLNKETYNPSLNYLTTEHYFPFLIFPSIYIIFMSIYIIFMRI